MLILSRRPGESVHVGDDIKITILSIKGQQIKLGLEATFRMLIHCAVHHRSMEASETLLAM